MRVFSVILETEGDFTRKAHSGTNLESELRLEWSQCKVFLGHNNAVAMEMKALLCASH